MTLAWPEMHTVEIAECDSRAAGIGRHVLPVGEYPHQSRAGTRTTASPSITTFSFTMHCVRRVALFRGRFKSVISTTAFTVCPMLHRDAEIQGLAQVDCARARQTRSQHGRDQAGGQHAVRDAAAEAGLAGAFLVKMNRIGIQADRGIHQDVGFGDRLGQVAV